MNKEKKSPFWLLRNSEGQRDGLWTLTVIAFIATTAAYFMSIIHELNIGSYSFSFREFDGFGYAAVVLIPLITGYFGRRYTKAQNEVATAQTQVYAELAKHKKPVKDSKDETAPAKDLIEKELDEVEDD